MKMFSTFYLALLWAFSLISQPWMNPPYLADSSKATNFYEIQKAFQLYEQEQYRIGNIKQVSQEAAALGKEGKFPGWAQFKRWEWNMAPRVYPTGDITQTARKYVEFQKYIASKVQNPRYQMMDGGSGIQAIFSGNWTPLGPTGNHFGGEFFGGAARVNFIRFDPTNSNTMWTGSPGGGLWKSTDGGTNWTTKTDQLSIIGCSDVAINPKNTNIMYLATGDANGTGSQLTLSSIGVLKSTDGGNTWGNNTMNWQVGWNRGIYKLLINPDHPDTIFAATSVGVFRSLNAGGSWASVQSGAFTDIEFKPNNPKIIYATAGVQSNGAFYKSTDGGATFAVVTSGLPPTANVCRMEIGVSPADTNLVYVVAVKKSTWDFYGFYRSTDGGDNFTLRANTPNILVGSPSSQAWYNLAMAVSPIHKDTIIVGGTDTYRSLDGGLTWAKHTANGVGAPLVHPDHHALEYLPGSDSCYFSGNDGGVWITTDRGANWTTKNEGLQIGQLYKLGSSKINANTIMTGHQDMATHQYKNGEWSIFTPNTGDGMECIYEYTNDTVVYLAMYNGRIMQAYNSRPLFNIICTTTGSGVNASGSWITPIIMHPTDESTLLVGKAQVWRTTNKGVNFTQVGNVSGGATNLIALAYGKSNTNYIYAAKSNKIFVSTDGNNFTDRTAGLPVSSSAITDVAVSNTDPNKAWVSFSGYSADKVWKTTDAGVTWSYYSTGLPNLPVNCITYENNSNDAIYIGTDVGVYTISDSLSSWQAFFTGLPNVDVQELEIVPSIGKIRAATNGRGLWESDLHQQSVLNLTVSSNSITTQAIANSAKSFDITSNTNWTITGNPAWLSINKTSGNGNANIILTVQENNIISLRSATLTIAATGLSPKTVIVTQEAAAPTLSVSSNTMSFGALENRTANLDVTSNTSWTITSSDSWLAANIKNGAGNSNIIFTAEENKIVQPRTAQIIISAIGVASQTISVRQDAALPVLTISTSTLTLAQLQNSSNSFTLLSNTSWTLTQNENWFKTNLQNGSGTMAVKITADENKNIQPRTATIIASAENVASQTITVVQLGLSPYLDLSANSMTINAIASSSYTFDVQSNTSWTATSNQQWLSISNPIGKDNTSITFSATENTATTTRTATISVSNNTENKNLLITQRSGEYIDLEVTSVSPTIKDSIKIGQSFPIEVVYTNNSTKPLYNHLIGYSLIECNTNYVIYYNIIQLDSIGIGVNKSRKILMGYKQINGPISFRIDASCDSNGDMNLANNLLKGECFFTDTTTSIETEQFSSANIFPNPTDGLINITNESAIEHIQLLDVLGRVVQESSPFETTAKLMITSPGIYFVRISNQSNYKTTKIEVFK